MIWQIMSYTYFQCNEKKTQIAHKNIPVASVFFSDNRLQFHVPVIVSFGQLAVELHVV